MTASNEPQPNEENEQSDAAVSFSRQWLLAMPSLVDSIFSRSVIYLCAHDEGGAMGLVLNNPATFRLHQVFEKLDVEVDVSCIENNTVLRGGPVSTEQGFVLHDGSTQWRGSKRLTPSVVLSPGRDILEAIAVGSEEAPSDYQVVFGYAGWGAGQLEEEMMDNSWLSMDLRGEQYDEGAGLGIDVDHYLMLNHPIESRWQQLGYSAGVDVSRLSWQCGHA